MLLVYVGSVKKIKSYTVLTRSNHVEAAVHGCSATLGFISFDACQFGPPPLSFLHSNQPCFIVIRLLCCQKLNMVTTMSPK